VGAINDLERYEAGIGYGVDALGRPGYNNQFSMGQGPRDFLATQAVHRDMQARAAQEDPSGMQIRALLEQLQRRNLPGNVSLPGEMFQLDGGGRGR
jgi:hypothetical protein